jgi:hypothetical protein
MAIMLPEIPKEYYKESMENIIFEKLAFLSDDYYVFHSFKLIQIKPQKNYDSEIDFLIFHPLKGVLVIEAKAGHVQYSQGTWRYKDGTIMKQDGPFNQAKNNKYKIIEMLREKDRHFNLANKCGFFHSVCFPSIRKGALMNTHLPAESPIDIILTRDELENMEESIDSIFHYHQNLGSTAHQSLNEKEVNFMLYNILSPSFNLVPSTNILLNEKNRRFHRMLDEQKILMDFLEQQRSAAISGAAGTGKTMLAVEKARRLAEQNDYVLFLCYNRELKDYLASTFAHPFISFYTLDAFNLKITGGMDQNYRMLETYLSLVFLEQKDFTYKHVIIDEGQDFGQSVIEEQKIIENLDIIMKDRNGCFYVFYDKNQLIQSTVIPSYINDTECRITLHRNCRNTKCIAETSMKPIKLTPILYEHALKGTQPLMSLISNENFHYKLNEHIDHYLTMGYTDIVILSVKSAVKSRLNIDFSDGMYNYKNKKFKWTTSRKFKGLEADVIILIDVDKDSFTTEQLIFYVGASRARLELSIIAIIDQETCKSIINNLNPQLKKFSVEKAIAAILNAISK